MQYSLSLKSRCVHPFSSNQQKFALSFVCDFAFHSLFLLLFLQILFFSIVMIPPITVGCMLGSSHASAVVGWMIDHITIRSFPNDSRACRLELIYLAKLTSSIKAAAQWWPQSPLSLQLSMRCSCPCSQSALVCCPFIFSYKCPFCVNIRKSTFKVTFDHHDQLS